MRDYEELDSGLYVPPLRTDIQARMERMVRSPMMEYLMGATFNEWAWGEGNWETMSISKVFDPVIYTVIHPP